MSKFETLLLEHIERLEAEPSEASISDPLTYVREHLQKEARNNGIVREVLADQKKPQHKARA